MDEKQVEVIKKVDGPVIRDRRKMGNRENEFQIICDRGRMVS